MSRICLGTVYFKFYKHGLHCNFNARNRISKRPCLFKYIICVVVQVRVVIKGRVQGVFYRNWTVENATELGLKGWVRNRRDGSVEALFSGSSSKVEEMEQRCRRGPRDAMVTGLEVLPCTDDPGSGFERRSTV